MTLPNISYPIHQIKIPSTKKSKPFRPFVTKEEKLLLMAKEGGTFGEVLSTIKQIVSNCSLEKSLDINKLTIFDLEYIFLKLRAASVDNISHVTYEDIEDKKFYEFDIDLDKVEVEYPKESSNVIPINDKMGITMKYPSASLYDDADFLKSTDDYLFQLIIRCIENIYDGETLYEAKDYTLKEVEEFMGNLDNKTFGKVNKFLSEQPTIKHVLEYTNEKGNERKISLTSLTDFFTLR